MTLEFPRFFKVRQRFDPSQVTDVYAEVIRTIGEALVPNTYSIATRHESLAKVGDGESVAIAIGSRGISQIGLITKAVVKAVQSLGANPFIVPAMGSHGGGTAEGQAGLLAGYGITAGTMGCPIRSSMETIEVGVTSRGVTVHIDANALGANHVIIVNRIKPHTRIIGKYESGLVKMMLIGLGKHRGAVEYHRAMTRQLFDDIVAEAAPMIMANASVLGGIALIENAFDEIAKVEFIAANRILEREPQLLEMARQKMPRLPFDNADLVIVDRIGKNISGTGMDTNVVGRKFNDCAAGPSEWPKVQQIYVRGLTPETKGNAAGIGIAEYCRTQVVREMDVEVTRVNCLTALHISAAAIPANWETDKEVLEVAIGQSGRSMASDIRWIWIRDTLHVGEVFCSEAYWGEAQSRNDLEVIGSPQPLSWDTEGNLHESW